MKKYIAYSPELPRKERPTFQDLWESLEFRATRTQAYMDWLRAKSRVVVPIHGSGTVQDAVSFRFRGTDSDVKALTMAGFKMYERTFIQ